MPYSYVAQYCTSTWEQTESLGISPIKLYRLAGWPTSYKEVIGKICQQGRKEKERGAPRCGLECVQLKYSLPQKPCLAGDLQRLIPQIALPNKEPVVPLDPWYQQHQCGTRYKKGGEEPYEGPHWGYRHRSLLSQTLLSQEPVLLVPPLWFCLCQSIHATLPVCVVQVTVQLTEVFTNAGP